MTRRRVKWALLVALAAGLGGCHSENFRSQRLGDVEPALAYRTALIVMRSYYPIATADERAGRIVSHAVPASQGDDILAGRTQQWQRASLRIREEENATWADVRVELLRPTRPDLAAADPRRRGEAPHHTPAQTDGPLTPEQMRSFQTLGHDYAREHLILADLIERLGPRRR